MTRRIGLTRTDYVQAAVDFTDEHGSDSLTLRSLGDSLGVAHTALYRHFRDKAELIAAMTNHLMTEAAEMPVAGDAPPEERLLQMARNVRKVFLQHPQVAVVTSTATRSTDTVITAVVVRELEALGVPSAQLTVCYQALESLVMGLHAHDLAGAPDHLEIRRRRHRDLGHPAFDEISRSIDSIDHNNDAAFEFAVRAVIAACAALGRTAPQ
jgi:AcrR family transcriptional regulator